MISARSSISLFQDIPKLADSLDAEGGLAMIILTHKDDIADHDKWKV
eukprot:gene60343-82568_t